jgi:D-serine deaminase-like pyridoxal phosphate-dependent protein
MSATPRAGSLADAVLGPEHKSLPPESWGRTAREFLGGRPRLSQFQTPVFTLDRTSLEHNLDEMHAWCADRGLDLAPHGKTTMSPQLWDMQLDRGAWAVSLATAWQVQLARRFGVRRILLANEFVDPVGLRWIADELRRDADLEFWCWADDAAQVEIMTRTFGADHAGRPLDVLVELGVPGGRSGARTIDAAVRVAELIAAAPGLRLAGVAGYEGAAAADRSDAALRAVGAYLDDLTALHRRLEERRLYGADAILTAGGSGYFDLVADRLQPFAGQVGPGGTRTRAVLRSGAYLAHDAGHYARVSPFAQPGVGETFREAMHVWTRTLSHPEPGLYITDAGRRDVPYDIDLPVPEAVAGRPDVDLSRSRVRALNDQHTFLESDADLSVGSVVRLGVSHPCTAFDKWRLVPVVDDADTPDPQVVDLIHLFF